MGFDGDPAEDAVMAIAEQTGVYAFSVDGGVDLVTFDGRNIEIELETSNSVSVVPLLTSNTPVTIDGTGNDSVTVTGRIKLMSSLEFSVERVGSSAPEFFDLDSIALEGTVNLASHAAITSFFDSEFGQDNFLRNIDVTYAPETAVAVASWSIEQASHNRAYYGALQNRLEYTVSNLTGISLYTASALSKIQDADYAVESARLSKAQILQQSAIAMLAQANASSQLAVTLIR